MPTIRDVARRANVAISTVSAVLNRSAPTSADVVRRVEAAIAEIGYAPQRAAQTLRSGVSRIIGIVVPDVTNPHFAQVARIVENECLAADYMTFVYNTDEDSSHEMRILRMMHSQRVAGLIHISTRSDAAHGRRLMAEIDVPIVLMGSRIAGAPFDLVALDDEKAGEIAAARLLDLGHRRLTIMGGRRGVSSHDERLKGVRRAYRQRGLALHEADVVLARFVSETARAEARRALTSDRPPTGIVSFTNLMSVGVLRAIRDLGLSCPRDLSFIGIDDLEWADVMNPRPTLLAQPIAEMTRCAIATLLDLIETGAPPGARRMRFDPILVERDSCGARG